MQVAFGAMVTPVPTHVLLMIAKSPGASSARALPPVCRAAAVIVSGASPVFLTVIGWALSAAAVPAATDANGGGRPRRCP